MEHINASEKLSAGLKAIPNKISSFASTQAAWRFYANEKVSLSMLQNPLMTAAHEGIATHCSLLGISKRGDAYLRTLLIHGARAVLRVSETKTDSLNCWLQNLCSRRNKNIAAVALANKNARIIWAILTKKTDYQMDGVAA